MNSFTKPAVVSFRFQSLCNSQKSWAVLMDIAPAFSMRLIAASCAAFDVPPTASTTIYTSYPSRNASKAGKARQTSVHNAVIISFFLPVAFTASTKSLSSQALRPVLSITGIPFRRFSSCGISGLLSPVATLTEDTTIGIPYNLAASAVPRILLINNCRSIEAMELT